jgi:hypothetical protein
MKKVFTLSFFCVSLLAAQAQIIPNASFEEWLNGNPVGWDTSNSSGGVVVSESNEAHAGNKAARLNAPTSAIPYMQTTVNGVTTFPTSLKGWYKADLAGTDQLSVAVLINNASAINVGSGLALIEANAGVYTQFTANIDALAPNPSTANIAITLLNPTTVFPSPNSTALVDDLTWGALDIEEVNVTSGFALEKIIPNPINGDACMLQYTLAESGRMEIAVYDLSGKQVANVLQLNQGAGRYRAELDLSGLSAGYYIVSAMLNGTVQTLPLVKN